LQLSNQIPTKSFGITIKSFSAEVSNQLNMGQYSIETFDEVSVHSDLLEREKPEGSSIEFFRSFLGVVRGFLWDYWGWFEVG
jgi:hypothetical protein